MLPVCELLLVLQWLPFVDVCRLRAVCKLWNQLILEYGMQNWEGLYRDDGKLWCPKTGEQRNFTLQDQSGNELMPLASSNGLLLCKIKNSHCTLKVGNPITGKWKDLPLPELHIPPTSAWVGRVHLLVDPEATSAAAGARFKATILLCTGWSKQPQPRALFSVTMVLQFDSAAGEWIRSDGLRCKTQRAFWTKAGTHQDWIRVHRKSLVTGWFYAMVFDVETLSWSGFRPALPLPNGSNWWSGLLERLFKFKNTDYIRVQGLGWARFGCHLYQGKRVIGAGILRDAKHDIGYGAIELHPSMQWTKVCSVTYDELFGTSGGKFECGKCLDSHDGFPGLAEWTMIQGNTIFWWPLRHFPPMAYDILKSTWSVWETCPDREYSVLSFNKTVNP